MPTCFNCKYGQLVYIEGKEYYICYRFKGGKLVEPRNDCPYFEPWEDEEPEWEDEEVTERWVRVLDRWLRLRPKLPITKFWLQCARCPYRLLCETYDQPLCLKKVKRNC